MGQDGKVQELLAAVQQREDHIRALEAEKSALTREMERSRNCEYSVSLVLHRLALSAGSPLTALRQTQDALRAERDKLEKFSIELGDLHALEGDLQELRNSLSSVQGENASLKATINQLQSCAFKITLQHHRFSKQ
jgi:prefoldin subunit 5